MNRVGFTLMEMLISLVIFSIIGLIAAKVSSSVFDESEEIIARNGRYMLNSRIAEVFRADCTQAYSDTIVNEYDGSGDTLALFTQNNFSAVNSQPVQVTYYVKDNKLFRIQKEADKPAKSYLLDTSVDKVEFAFYDKLLSEFSSTGDNRYIRMKVFKNDNEITADCVRIFANRFDYAEK